MTRTGALVLLVLANLATGPLAAALELEDCRISAGPAFPSIKARCGMFLRPQNPDDPDSPLLDIKVAVVPALNLEPEPDPVVPLAGGPGQSATRFYAAYANAFEFARRNRDILIVDQRGTGDSSRMNCPVDDSLVAGQYSKDLTVRYTKECLAALPHDPRYFSTSVAVRDLEAVREALGYPALNLYGASYGTRVAQHYARRYPHTTRTIVLDGVVPPELALGPGISVEAQSALEAIFARCERDDSCNERFPKLADTFAKLRAKLESGAVRVRSAHPVTGAYESVPFGPQELAAAIRLLAYRPNTVAMIPLLVSEAGEGNYGPLVAQYQMTMISLSDSLALGMHNAVVCTEDVPFIDVSRDDRRAIDASYIGPVQLAALEAICSVWPAGPLDADFRQPLATTIPTLLLSGGADPITPPAYADMAARNLRRAWLLTLPEQGHGTLMVGCMPRIFEQFVVAAGLEGVDTSCLERNFVMPFFLDYSGPAP